MWVYSTGYDPWNPTDQIKLASGGVLQFIPIVPTDTIAYTLWRIDLYAVIESSSPGGSTYPRTEFTCLKVLGLLPPDQNGNISLNTISYLSWFVVQSDIVTLAGEQIPQEFRRPENQNPLSNQRLNFNSRDGIYFIPGSDSDFKTVQTAPPGSINYSLGALELRNIYLDILINGAVRASLSGVAFNATRAGYQLGLGYFFWTNCGYDLSDAGLFSGLNPPITESSARAWLDDKFHLYVKGLSSDWDPAGKCCCCDDILNGNYAARLAAIENAARAILGPY